MPAPLYDAFDLSSVEYFYSSILLGSFSFFDPVFRFLSHFGTIVRDASGSVVSTSSTVLAPVSYMIFSTFLTFDYLLCCNFPLTSIFKAAVHSLVICAV